MLDNQMLLLLVLGIAIYYLTRPDEAPEPANKKIQPKVESVKKEVPQVQQVQGESRHQHASVENFADANEKEQEQETPKKDSVDLAKEVVMEAEQSGFAPLNNDEDLTTIQQASQSLHADGVNPNAIPDRKQKHGHDYKDFLPSEKKDNWFQSVTETMIDDSALIKVKAGHHIGVNTVGQSLRNATYDLRGTLANPKSVVSPWMNSTIEPDTNIKSFCS